LEDAKAASREGAQSPQRKQILPSAALQADQSAVLLKSAFGT